MTEKRDPKPSGVECAAQLRTQLTQIERQETAEGGQCLSDDRVLRATIRLARVSPLDWLAEVGDSDLRFYGSTRDRAQALEIGGVGVADEAVWQQPVRYRDVVDRLRGTLHKSPPNLRYYGGFRFAPNSVATTDRTWSVFGVSRFIVPRLELISSREGSLLSLHLRPHELHTGIAEHWLSRVEAFSFAPSLRIPLLPVPEERTDNPDYSGWEENVQSALQDVERGDLEKIVLARKVDFQFNRPLDPVALLQRLKSATPDCFHFCYMPAREIAFIGASPERLYYREGRSIQTEAVAGTRMRGHNAEADQRLAAELLASEKEQREHACVRDGIRDVLTPLCERLDMDEEARLFQLARGQHLYSAVSGQLRRDVGDADLLEALHPTPALGGTPRKRALARIAELEPFDRGWYAAPVGWVSATATEFSVAIRCGLVQPEKLSLFSGAGIVAGSTPASEWEEIELKIRDFIKVLTET